MAKSRLTPDYIEWVMSLNANQALSEIHKVNEQTKEFERQQNAARQAIVKLAAEGLTVVGCDGYYNENADEGRHSDARDKLGFLLVM